MYIIEKTGQNLTCTLFLKIWQPKVGIIFDGFDDFDDFRCFLIIKHWPSAYKISFEVFVFWHTQ
mgnify:CR=1 FL=1